MSSFGVSEGYIELLKKTFGLNIEDDSMLEKYLKKNYKLVPNIAYKNKRKVSGLSYSIFLNELVTPNAFLIKKDLMKGVILSQDPLQRIRNVGNIVAKRIEWTDDKNLDTSGDYYLFPSETLTLNWGDCEDHAFIMMSALPKDIGGAWGFYKKGGHAFNVALIEGELYVVDTVADSVTITPYASQSDYTINYIITQKYTFAVDASVNFGEIAGWSE
jgi:hypothetical protein